MAAVETKPDEEVLNGAEDEELADQENADPAGVTGKSKKKNKKKNKKPATAGEYRLKWGRRC